ncbi:MAG: hypothetical protein AAF432_08450 [Planctomycetota bacterium]
MSDRALGSSTVDVIWAGWPGAELMPDGMMSWLDGVASALEESRWTAAFVGVEFVNDAGFRVRPDWPEPMGKPTI